MSAVLTINTTASINIAAVMSVTSSVITTKQIPATIASNLALVNSNGAALAIDLAAWGQLSLASTTQLIDFSSLADPNGTTHDWTGGRVRLFVVQTVTTTTAYDLQVYADATNGVSFLPPVANYVPVRTNGGILIIYDPNSNGSGNGNVITASLKRLDFNSGSNTVVFNWLALGNSVA